jgi:hypothetical protein
VRRDPGTEEATASGHARGDDRDGGAQGDGAGEAGGVMDRPTHSAEMDRRQMEQIANEALLWQQSIEAADLATVALLTFKDDRLVAMAWMQWTWRSNPSAYEVGVRALAVDMVSEGLTDTQRETWAIMMDGYEGTAITHDPGVYELAPAIATKHERHLTDDATHIGAADESIIERLRSAA